MTETHSIVRVVRAKKRRGGIYVLGFANGERYVGRSKDVVKRFLQHRAVHTDITSFTYLRVRREDQAGQERACVAALEAGGVLLRNRALMSAVRGASEFDGMVPVDGQSAWLETGVLPERDVPPEDTFYADLRRRYAPRFAAFLERDDARSVLGPLGRYLRSCIPYPEDTAASFWSLSCLPVSNVLSRVNINMQEVLTLAEVDAQVLFRAHLARSPFEEDSSPSWRQDLLDRGLYLDNHYWVPGGADQFRIEAPIEALDLLLQDPIAVRAMRLLNLRLMRKGQCFWSRYHCPDLMSAALEAEARGATP